MITHRDVDTMIEYSVPPSATLSAMGRMCRPYLRAARSSSSAVRVGFAVLAFAVSFGAVSLEPSRAHAAEAAAPEAETMVLVRRLTGPNAEQLQVQVEGAVAERFSAVSASKEEDTELANGSSVLVNMSREKKYRGYVGGELEKTPKGLKLTLTVYSGHDGAAVGSVDYTAKNVEALQKKVDNEAGKALNPLIQKTAVAEPADDVQQTAKESVTLEAEVEDDGTDDTGGEPEAARPSPLDLTAAFGFTDLLLSYNEPVSDAYGYALNERPTSPITLRGAGHLYPGAFFTDNALADIGLAASYYQSIAGSIRILEVPYDLSYTELNIGLRGRIRVGDSELGINAGFGQTQVDVPDDNVAFLSPVADPSPNAQIDPGIFPDSNYTYLRFGIDGRVPIVSALSLAGGFFFRLPTIGDDVGELGESRWFPHATADGFDAQLFALYDLGGGVSILAGGDLRVYGMTMHSGADDINNSAIAGGAEDRFLGAFLGLELKL